MALPEVNGAFYPTEAEVRDQLLRTIRLMHARRGRAVNVLPGSDYFILATSMARIVVIAFANNKVALRDVSPLTASGENLHRLAKVFGVDPRPAAGASGALVVKCTGTVVIPQDFGCTAANGQRYRTSASVTVVTGDLISVFAADTGADTDQVAGSMVTWDSAAIGALASTATVAPGGITGGSNGDTEEQLRDRLLQRLAFPPQGGNWAQMKGWAEDASAAVESAFVYPAVRGPGSVDLAITKAGGDRLVNPTVLALATSSVLARVPGYASVLMTGVQTQYVDVTVAAKLPLPTFAGGAGGGWHDATPWPSDDARVVASFGGVLDIATTGSPSVGSRIAFWDPAAGALVDMMVTSVIPLVGLGVRITVAPVNGGASPLWIVTGMYVSAGSVQGPTYAAELRDQIARLGPGEKTASPDLLPRALRKPAPDVAAPSDLSSLLLSAITQRHPEILSLDWGVRRVSGTLTPITSPPLPLTTSDPPFILALGHLAIRRG